MPHPVSGRTRTPQRPMWQQLGIWVVALGVAFGLVVSGNAALSESANQPQVSSPSSTDAGSEGSEDVAEAPPPSSTEDEAEATADAEISPVPEADQELEQDVGQDVASEADYLTAAAQLSTLPIKPRAPRDGYSREGQFGRTWLDVDRNGCDTRNDILARDLDDTVVDSRCRVLSGILREPFSGDTIFFERGETTSALVHIDHVVALSNAWQTGASEISESQRVAFANDPLNLIAVSGRLNQQKGDSDAASWLPPETDYWCEYVARQVGVKAHYSLWVTQAEHDQMVRVLRGCPGYPALSPEAHARYRPGMIPLPLVSDQAE